MWVIRFFIAAFLFMLLIGCTKPDQPQELTRITALQQNNTDSNINSIRRQAIQDTALSLGAQAGLAWRAHQLNQVLVENQANLNRIFNFTPLILKNNVLPPVLVEGDDTLNLASPTAIRLADKVYKIELPPRFITVPPTWRDYLWSDYRNPDKPNTTLLPKNSDERTMWNQYIKVGWQAGVKQADQIFSINLGRLKRDYAGMILYRKLLAQNMVSPPFVAKLALGVTGNGNMMRINDTVLRITSTSQLNTNAKTWKPIIRPGYSGGENQDVDITQP